MIQAQSIYFPSANAKYKFIIVSSLLDYNQVRKLRGGGVPPADEGTFLLEKMTDEFRARQN